MKNQIDQQISKSKIKPITQSANLSDSPK